MTRIIIKIYAAITARERKKASAATRNIANDLIRSFIIVRLKSHHDVFAVRMHSRGLLHWLIERKFSLLIYDIASTSATEQRLQTCNVTK